LLAMVVNDDAGCLNARAVLSSIAGRPAPTEGVGSHNKKRPRISEAFYLGFNLFNVMASTPETFRTRTAINHGRAESPLMPWRPEAIDRIRHCLN
jgi:hypothetical protein